MTRPALRCLVVVAAGLAAGGCSIRRMAIDAIGDSLGGSGSLAAEEDWELARDAAPFGLKTLESLHAEAPDHPGILTALASGFAQYAYAFVLQEADFLEASNSARSAEQHQRGKKLALRGRDYGLKALELRSPGFEAALRKDVAVALKPLTAADVPLLYWTGASWALAITADKTDMALLGEMPLVEAMMKRALELDEAWDHGTLHEFFVSYESRGEAAGGSVERARKHYDRSVDLSQGKRAGMRVTWAESVCVAKQDRRCFKGELERVMALDLAASPPDRLANVVARRRAKWLLSRTAELFIAED